MQYKTAFVLAHKLREAMGSEVHNPDEPELSGIVDTRTMIAFQVFSRHDLEAMWDLGGG